MIDRRTLLGSSGALMAAALAPAHAKDDAARDVKIDPTNMTSEQIALHSVRFPKLDDQSYMNFIEGAKIWHAQQPAHREYTSHMEAFLKSKGLSTLDDTDLDHEACWNLLQQDPVYAARTRVQWTLQDLMWERAVNHFHGDRDKYLAAMEATDHAGPGKLELNPGINIPDYTRHEIHRQPGGYVGDPFGGWVYHWALTTAFYQGRRHDEWHEAIAQSHPLPADRKVRRILDIGCSSGMTTTAYKERFPDAEVWGIDVGAPMVRYAHHRAAKMNLACNFRQALAEDTKFPDNYFDLVNDLLLFHEVSAEAAGKIVPEMYRIMRPGAVWKHNDTPTEGNPVNPPSKTVTGKAAAWNSMRGNYEPWWIERLNTDMPGLLRKAGFVVDLGQKGSTYAGFGGQPAVVAIKPT